MKFNFINTYFFILCFSMLICASGTKLFARELKIKHIKINNKLANWAELSYVDAVDYSYLSSEGMPGNLEIPPIISLSFIYETEYNSKSEYRYKLVGKETAWNIANNTNEARYINLKPGYYSFVLQEFDGIKVLQEKKFDFKMTPSKADYLSSDLMLLSYNLLFLGVFYYIIMQIEKSKKLSGFN